MATHYTPTQDRHPIRSILLALALTATAAAQQPIWTGSWAAAPVAAPSALATVGPDGTTFRDIVHLSLGGKAIRLRISNEGSSTQLKLADVHAALAYYFDHIEEIQQEMKAERAFAEEFRGARTLRAASALLPTPGA